MRVNEFLVRHSRRAAATGTVAAVLAFAGCDAFKPPEACSVSIAPQNITVGMNSATQVVGTPFDCKGATLRNKRVSYSSNNTQVATVTEDGQVIGVSVGQTQISATSNGHSASAQVTVVPEEAATVTVTPNPYVMRVGAQKQYSAVAKNSRNEEIVGRIFQWSSSNSSIASVDGSGNVSAHNVGTVTIVATTDNRTGSATLQVTLVPLGKCELTPANRKLTITGQFQPTLVLRDTADRIVSNSGRSMLWTSDNEVNATVSSTGVVTARKAGFATITAAWPENTTIKCDMTIEAVEPRIVTATIQGPRPNNLRLTVPKQFTVQLLDSLNQPIPAGRVVTWKSVDPSIATVTSAGVVTGINLGNGRIAVDAEGAVDTVNINVTKIPAAKITLSPTQQSVVQGGTVNITAVVEDSVGTTVTDRPLEWNSSDPLRAVVTSTGATTAQVQTFGNGTVTITASTETRSGNSQVIIQQVPADSIAVVDAAVSFEEDKAGSSFSYTVLDANGNQLLGRTVSISSSHPTIARVVNGAATVTNGIVNVDPQNVGTATFTMRALNALGQPEGKTTRVTVTVTPKPATPP